MRFDLKRINEKIEFVEKNLARLRKLRDLSEKEFFADFRNTDAAGHELQVSIEAMLDILSHLVARMRLGSPTNDAELLELAREHGLISDDHYRRFFQMPKFRNLVVHGYMRTDEKRIHAILRESLTDLDLFLSDVHNVIQAEQKSAKPKNGNGKNKK